MSTLQEQIAAATIAKIFGSELKTVDENTLQQSSSGPATKIDPMSFITAVQEKRVQQQQQQVIDANRLAEQLYPLPPSEFTPVAAPVQPEPSVAQPVQHRVQPVADPAGFTKEDIQSIRSQLEKVNATLTKMSGMLGKVFATFTEKNKLQ